MNLKKENLLTAITDILKQEKEYGTLWLYARKSNPKGNMEGDSLNSSTNQQTEKVRVKKAKGIRLEKIGHPLSTTNKEEIERRRKILVEIEREVKGCRKCPLYESKTNVVVHDGSPVARLCFVGEGPGAEEDATGVPFVGRAGKLLTAIIESMGLKRQDTFICNTVKCRPPNNRTPTSEEMEACFPYLEKQIETVAPDCIVTLGLPAAQRLVGKIGSVSRFRGCWMEYRTIPTLITYHPAYLLRNPSAKKLLWEDMKKVWKYLSEGKIEGQIVKQKSQEKTSSENLSLFKK